MYMFRLPGEAQKIDRLMRVFSEHYHGQCCVGGKWLSVLRWLMFALAASNCGPDSSMPLVRDALKSWKEAYTLVFALIMLNVDAHTEGLPKRMVLFHAYA